jgi:large subunit ribosomal protein L17
MRHSKVINHLGRTSSHRKAMMANMATSLILYKRIRTTVPKAKALKTYVEPLITKSKEDSTHSRRVAVAELFREISPKIAERPGGYTRILKTGNRIGDNAEMCILELVDYNELMKGGAEAAKAKTSRRRRSPKKKGEAEAGEKKAPEAKAKEPEKNEEPETAPEER